MEVEMQGKLFAAAVGVAAMIAVPLTGTAQASTDNDRAYTAVSAEIDTAQPGTPPSDITCLSAPQGARGCFRTYGDQWWVLDTDTPYAAIAVWENELWDGDSWEPYRNGQCENKLGEGHWGVCNKDYYEDSSRNAYGGYGSRVRWRACGVFGCSSWSAWTRNNG
ncbi:hypothetical protein AB0F11_27815 [Streptomyces sp. NPDC032472]|uniref:hypothetical protein n=1 Tax=Streptomyces sp. NPDC032472 TaxID=3155018 RepID=UPI0033F7FBC9